MARYGGRDDDVYTNWNPTRREYNNRPSYSDSYGHFNAPPSRGYSESTLDSYDNSFYEPHTYYQQEYNAYVHQDTADNYARSNYYNPREDHQRRDEDPRNDAFIHREHGAATSHQRVRGGQRHRRWQKPTQILRQLAPDPPYIAEDPFLPIPTVPSPEYWQTSSQQSLPVHDLSTNRKLLVLDLNGTLLYRDEYKPRSLGQPYKHRIARPRPYMSAFRQFLFHPDTRSWLDTMVWSSARPTNVDTMVNEAFGEDRSELVAIWARDTLGLSAAEYHGKTQTTKDLTRPWAKMVVVKPSMAEDDGKADMEMSSDEEGTTRSKPTDDILSSSLRPPATTSSILHPEADEQASVADISPSDAPPLSTSSGVTSASVHSAMSTILLDDSPLKARLQPWNHLCIPEYTGELRKRDIATKQSEESQGVQTDVNADPEADINAGSEANDSAQSEVAEVNSPFPKSAERKRKRAKKKNAKKFVYDRTLLAVIGVLHTLKTENNVAAWMRSGGLMNIGVSSADAFDAPKRRKLNDAEETDIEMYASEEPASYLSIPVPNTQPLEPHSSLLPPTPPSPHLPPHESPSEGRADPASSSQLANISPSPTSIDLPPSSQQMQSSPVTSPRESPSSPQPVQSSPLTTPESVLDLPPTALEHAGLSQHQTWFKESALVEYWAKRGLEALQLLGITPDPGVS